MKYFLRNHFLIGLLVLTAFFSLLPSQVFAAGETIKLTSSTGTSQLGQTFTLSVDGHTGTTPFTGGAFGITGTLKFPANLLKVVDGGINTTGTPFTKNNNVSPDNSAGTISIKQSNDWWNNVSSKDIHLFSVTFQTLSSGVASVNFDSVQYLYLTGTANAVASGGTYSINSPTPTPTPTPVPAPTPTFPSSNNPAQPTPKPSVAPQSNTQPDSTLSQTPTPEETPTPVVESDGGLKIEDVKITTNRQENKVSWSMNSKSVTPTLTYGTSKDSLKSTGNVVTSMDDGYEVVFTNLKPGTLYYFTIKASTDDNLQGATYSGVLTTRGYPVQLTIEQSNLSLPGARVKINERSFTANKDALILTELPDGQHIAYITPPNSSETYSVQFTVARKSLSASGNPELQNIVLNIAAVINSSTSLDGFPIVPIVGGIAGITTLVVGGIGFLMLRRRQRILQDTGVDSDLLSTSYGQDINQYRHNTPEPNLDTADSSSQMPLSEPPPLVTMSPDVQAQDAAQPVPVIGQVPPSEQQALSPTEQPLVANSYNPAPLPIPTTTSGIPVVASELLQEEIPDYTEEQQLSPELTQVEATHPVEDQEPSAIFHQETGELEIMHHHVTKTHTPQSPVTAI